MITARAKPLAAHVPPLSAGLVPAAMERRSCTSLACRVPGVPAGCDLVAIGGRLVELHPLPDGAAPMEDFVPIEVPRREGGTWAYHTTSRPHRESCSTSWSTSPFLRRSCATNAMTKASAEHCLSRPFCEPRSSWRSRAWSALDLWDAHEDCFSRETAERAGDSQRSGRKPSAIIAQAREPAKTPPHAGRTRPERGIGLPAGDKAVQVEGDHTDADPHPAVVEGVGEGEQYATRRSTAAARHRYRDRATAALRQWTAQFTNHGASDSSQHSSMG